MLLAVDGEMGDGVVIFIAHVVNETVILDTAVSLVVLVLTVSI